ncbi:TPA: hypothetical protein HA244_04645, partial [Candidatus Micrarchaeota archaeon]|nr:hypothetical protein [Candidatus Micrarchaeota archaeon]
MAEIQQPKIRVLIHYGSHGNNRDDARHIKKAVSGFKPHFYSPEWLWSESPEEVERLNGLIPIARADLKQREKFLHDTSSWGDKTSAYIRKELEAIVDTPGAKVCNLQATTPERLEQYMREFQAGPERVVEKGISFYLGDFENALRQMHEHAVLSIKNHEMREEDIIKNMRGFRRELSKHPELHGEKEIRIYVRIGGEHTPLTEALRKLPGIEVDEANDSPPEFERHDTIAQLMNRKRQQELNDPEYRRVLARAFLGSMLNTFLLERTGFAAAGESAGAVMAGNFSENEI